LSLQRYDLRFPSQAKFVGLSNYAAVLSSSYWWNAFFVTLIITAISVAIELVLGMGLAIVMHRTIFGRGAVRTSILIPTGSSRSSPRSAGSTRGRPARVICRRCSATPRRSPTRCKPFTVIILAEVWKTTPFMALLLMAGLALVPEDLQKAARVDGATAWQRFVRVTLPLMKPAILVALLFRTSTPSASSTNIFVLTSGGHSTGSVSILGYDNLFSALNLGIGSAISVLIFIAVAIIAFLFIKGFGAAAPGRS